MEYTYQEKCVAAIERKLWWRFPDTLDSDDRKWTLITDDLRDVESSDLSKPGAEYHIGDEPPKPPRVLSELEQELLEALEHSEAMLLRYGIDDVYGGEIENAAFSKIRAAIAKAKGEA